VSHRIGLKVSEASLIEKQAEFCSCTERESTSNGFSQARYKSRDHGVDLMIIGALYHSIDRNRRAPSGTQHSANFRQAPHGVGKEHQSEIAQYRVETRIGE